MSKKDYYFQDVHVGEILLVGVVNEEKVSVNSMIKEALKYKQYEKCQYYIFVDSQIIVEDKEFKINP